MRERKRDGVREMEGEGGRKREENFSVIPKAAYHLYIPLLNGVLGLANDDSSGTTNTLIASTL